MSSLKTSLITSAEIPLVIEPTDQKIPLSDSLNLIGAHKDFIRQNLLKYGGVLLRKFPIQNEHDFVSVIKTLELGNFINYIGGDSPRNKIIEGVYTSTEAPPSFKIPLHNELSYVKSYPSHIYFFCDTPPIANGQTTIADARKLYQLIDPSIRDQFIEKGLRYVSCYPCKSKMLKLINRSHKSWINVFETEDKQEVEKKCLENDIDFEWHYKDWIEISQQRPAIIEHPITNEKVWFNQAHHFDFNPKLLSWLQYIGVKILYCRKHTMLHQIFFADDTKIPRDAIYHILDVLDQNTVYFPWQKGDVLILDNILAMHGRASFQGKRRILTAMTG